MNDAFIYPQRVGPGRTTLHRNQRLRYLLAHPEHVRGEHAFMRALTESPEHGVEFVERWNLLVVSAVVLGLALVSLSIALAYGWFTGDWPNGFTIACELVLPSVCAGLGWVLILDCCSVLFADVCADTSAGGPVGVL